MTEIARNVIEADHGNARKSLTAERRESAAEYLLQINERGREAFRSDLYSAASLRANEEKHEADKLADYRCERRAADTHIEHEHKDRVECDIDDCSADDTDHRIKGVALKSRLVIEHERRRHYRRADKDIGHIRNGMVDTRIGRTEQERERTAKGESENGYHHAKDH